MLETAFQPLQLGPLTLPNRFIKAGANENMSKQGRPTRAMRMHHSNLHAGGGAAIYFIRQAFRTLTDLSGEYWEYAVSLDAGMVPERASGNEHINESRGTNNRTSRSR